MLGQRPDWNTYFLGIAEAVAQRADCTRSKVGAVLVNARNEIRGTGYNGSPAGLPGCLTDGACPRGRLSYDEVLADSDYSNCVADHAERNALRHSRPEDLKGATLYVTRPPCPSCTTLINACGIVRVVTPEVIDPKPECDHPKNRRDVYENYSVCGECKGLFGNKGYYDPEDAPKPECDHSRAHATGAMYSATEVTLYKYCPDCKARFTEKESKVQRRCAHCGEYEGDGDDNCVAQYEGHGAHVCTKVDAPKPECEHPVDSVEWFFMENTERWKAVCKTCGDRKYFENTDAG